MLSPGVRERVSVSAREDRASQSYVDDTKLITSFELKANLDAIADLEDDLFKPPIHI